VYKNTKPCNPHRRGIDMTIGIIGGRHAEGWARVAAKDESQQFLKDARQRRDQTSH